VSRDLATAHAVSCGVEWRREHTQASLAGRNSDDSGADAAFARKTNFDVIGAFPDNVGEQRMNRAAALFFGLLLSLIITLFDRYRALRADRTEAATEAIA